MVAERERHARLLLVRPQLDPARLLVFEEHHECIVGVHSLVERTLRKHAKLRALGKHIGFERDIFQIGVHGENFTSCALIVARDAE